MEFALVLVPMMLLLLGAIQFGVIWATQIGVTNAVRDAARAASLAQPKSNAAGLVTTVSETAFAGSINSTVLDPAMAANIPFYGSGHVELQQICYSTVSDVAGADQLIATVTVRYGHPIFIPLLSGILGSTIPVTSTISIPVGMEKPFELPAVGTNPGCST